MFTRQSLGVGRPARSEPWRRWALPVLRSPAGRDVGGCEMLRETMPAIVSLEDLKSAQEEFLEAKDLNELKAEVRLNELIRKNLAKLEVKE